MIQKITTYTFFLMLFPLGVLAADLQKGKSFDFGLMFNSCKLVLSNTDDTSIGIRNSTAESVSIFCSRENGKANCKWLNSKNEQIAEDTLKLLELEGRLNLFDDLHNDRIYANPAKNGAVYIVNYVMPTHPEIRGVKICSGSYASSAEIKGALEILIKSKRQ